MGSYPACKLHLSAVWGGTHYKDLAETHLARYLWPKELPTLVTETRNKDKMPVRQVIPTELGELLK